MRKLHAILIIAMAIILAAPSITLAEVTLNYEKTKPTYKEQKSDGNSTATKQHTTIKMSPENTRLKKGSDNTVTAPRDAASGRATGKRMH